MGDRTANLGIYIPAHAEENWDLETFLDFNGSLRGLDALIASLFFTSTPVAGASDWNLWSIIGNKKGWIFPVNEVATAPTGNELGNDGWRVLIDGPGVGVFFGHDNEIAVWDDTLTIWDFHAVNTDGNWVFDIALENQYYFKGSAWHNPSGVTAFEESGTASIGVPDSGVKVVTFSEVQPNTDYRTLLTPDTIGSMFVTNKTVNGFQINAQSSGWVGNVDWCMTRKDDTLGDDKSGTDTIVAGGIVDVTFSVPFIDANYQVILTPTMNAAMFVTNKVASGFRINAQSSGITGDVDWIAKHG